MHLRGIHILMMGGCNQATITDTAFIHLRGIHILFIGILFIGCCNQTTITDAAFVHLRAAFVHLRGVRALITTNCSPAVQAAAAALLAMPRSSAARAFANAVRAELLNAKGGGDIGGGASSPWAYRD